MNHENLPTAGSSESPTGSKSSRDPKDQSLPPEQALLKQRNLMMLTFYLLIDSAMGYREGFYRENIEGFEQESMAAAINYGKDLNYAKHKSLMRRANSLSLAYKEKEEKFTKDTYKYIETLFSGLGDEQKVAYDNMKTCFGLLAEEVIKAKDRTRLLTVVRLFNEGHFDEMFNDLDKVQQQENPSSDVVSDGDHLKT